ncbi:SIR2 family NAD-dependent protein deacylase [Desulfobulbus alkaliphilus]|uniref:SIR2 family NAD-dependent protein deacylase n=1 Tax=Desulfobulbus alkaliphilus TaxID=869814 RepID=UPI00196435F8|nr:NAD-dependent deacylase [Desulfobulbus alkaliphilus]MBM9537294.1 NAD-dependent deacylase [Desulfobulbus alkaliphilus]
MYITISQNETTHLAEAATVLRTATKVVALTGAGISVASGIPDFRSPGGLWTVFSPEEYATLEVFLHDPAKAWQLYRALGKVLLGKKPNPAHLALAELEQAGLVHGIITQNVDNLHQQAGSRRVFEIHGDHQHLQCLQCDLLQPAVYDHFHSSETPICPQCGFPLKPNVVLFGEAVRDLEAIHHFIADCDLLLAIGTSAQVYPAAELPSLVRRNGGSIFECNREQALTAWGYGSSTRAKNFFFQGDAEVTLPLLAAACQQHLNP